MLNKKPVLIFLSIVIAVFLWVYVTGNVDPETKSKANNIPVTFTNTEELAKEDLAVVQEETLTTSVVITGKRSYVNQAKSNGITASVDVSNAQEGENELSVEFQTPTGVSIDESTDVTVTVKVENRTSKEVPVEIEFVKNKNNAEGESPWPIAINPDTVTVYGAESMVSKVKAVKGLVEAKDISNNAKNVKAKISAIDKSGNNIEGMEYDRTSVMTTVRLLHKKSVPVEINIRNLKRDYEAENITGDLDVIILGTEDVLSRTESITANADLSEVDKAGTVEVNLEPVLPYGVYLENDIEEKGKFTITENE